MYLITVKISQTQNLLFTVETFERKGTHIVFTDTYTGLLKSFPDNICLIEQKEARG